MKSVCTVFIFWLFIVMGACTKSIVLDVDQQPAKLVVNSVFAPDSIWRVQVSSNLSVQGVVKFSPVRPATVELIDDLGNSILLDQYVEPKNEFALGYYSSFSNPFPDEERDYTLQVAAQNFKPIIANGTIPKKIKGTDFQASNVSVEESLNSRRPTFLLKTNLKFKLIPPTDEDHYFVGIRLYYFRDYDINSLAPRVNGQLQLIDTLRRENLAFKLLNVPNVIASYVWGNDVIFDISTEDLTDNLQLDVKSLIRLKDTMPTEFFVEIVHLSESLYNYHKTYTEQLSVKNDPFSEIVNVYSNIENGLGIFGGYNSFVKRVKL